MRRGGLLFRLFEGETTAGASAGHAGRSAPLFYRRCYRVILRDLRPVRSCNRNSYLKPIKITRTGRCGY
jgi:hypothetical protein